MDEFFRPLNVTPTNVKPYNWYREYFNYDGEPISYQKDRDSRADRNMAYFMIDEENHWMIRFVQRFTTQVMKEMNTLKKNKQILEECKETLKRLDVWRDIEKVKVKSSVLALVYKINKCFEALEQGYLITSQLCDIMFECDYLDKRAKEDQSS